MYNIIVISTRHNEINARQANKIYIKRQALEFNGINTSKAKEFIVQSINKRIDSSMEVLISQYWIKVFQNWFSFEINESKLKVIYFNMNKKNVTKIIIKLPKSLVCLSSARFTE